MSRRPGLVLTVAPWGGKVNLWARNGPLACGAKFARESRQS